ncbi:MULTISPECIES: WhiB family transcriptional regulator [unclassified Streptomyces]|uniref:WhiB family transcriptional regulator n=1 Tax=unclassified Streptomyces TaxID=2593676 RepID=UPI000DC7CDC0|nr:MULTISPECIES: WhiB family transcriptional regulator [unclassified Streptomyces]AWZ07601.1 WhiB family transcriptional regulator [Streptomyces sp. ICC4]AWZ14861.1 WhiB family transcriptional regulator [Streptomyces sp. ICC1]
MTSVTSATALTSASTSPRIPEADVTRLPGSAVHHWEWQTYAACRELGSSRFFHPAGERGEEREERDAAAKRVCGGCPVREACLEHALRTREPFGVWGGKTEEERKALARPSRARRAAMTAPKGQSGPSGPDRSATPGRPR